MQRQTSSIRSGLYIWAIGVTLVLATLLGCAATIWDLHREVIEQQRIEVRNLGVVLAEQTARYVQVVDLVLQEMQSRVASVGIDTPEEFAHSFAIPLMRDLLRERLKNLPQANSFFLVSAAGRTLVHRCGRLPSRREKPVLVPLLRFRL